MSRGIWMVMIVLALQPLAPTRAPAQLGRMAIGAGLGVVGGAAVTLAAIVARARFQHEYLDSPEDLIHWQTAPMVLAPAAGVIFGLAGDEAVRGSFEGSVAGMVVGAAAGTGIGWILSTNQESPWAGGVIGAGLGLAAGGLVSGVYAWSRDDDPDLNLPRFLRMSISVPVP